MSTEPYLNPDELDNFDRSVGVEHRYKLLKGKYGPYFYDSSNDHAQTLENVLDRLNEIGALKDRLYEANKLKRGKKW